MYKILFIEEHNIKRRVFIMSKKLSVTKLKMAAIANHMMEAGAELYSNPEARDKIKKKIEDKKEPK